MYRRHLKRALDVAAAAAALLVLLPLLAIIAVAVRLHLGSPVLFRHARPGLHGRLFTMLKFRTMRDACDAAGRPLPDGARLTRLGALLRSTSLDELPQLWNVLRGDMSLIGPRPLLVEYLERYTPAQARRHDVRPGITGLAQVNGRNAVGWDQKFAMDVAYVDGCSLLVDLRILLRTVGLVVARSGVNQPGHATVEKYVGPVVQP
jgi:lipopolysaccharide/colanic/teichoic acid biosynthesis glycosyltransferase